MEHKPTPRTGRDAFGYPVHLDDEPDAPCGIADIFALAALVVVLASLVMVGLWGAFA